MRDLNVRIRDADQSLRCYYYAIHESPQAHLVVRSYRRRSDIKKNVRARDFLRNPLGDSYRLSPLHRCGRPLLRSLLLSPQPRDQVSILSGSDRPGASQRLIELLSLGSNSRKGMRRHLFTGTGEKNLASQRRSILCDQLRGCCGLSFDCFDCFPLCLPHRLHRLWDNPS